VVLLAWVCMLFRGGGPWEKEGFFSPGCSTWVVPPPRAEPQPARSSLGMGVRRGRGSGGSLFPTPQFSGRPHLAAIPAFLPLASQFPQSSSHWESAPTQGDRDLGGRVPSLWIRTGTGAPSPSSLATVLSPEDAPGNIPKGRILQAPARRELGTRCGAGAHPDSGFLPVT